VFIMMTTLLLAIIASCFADVYMHNPRGSNNRLQEANAERTNGNRLFDSQNNNRGGYNVGDRTTASANTESDNPDNVYNVADTNTANQYQMAYFEQSKLSIEWTNQHSCGGNEQDDPNKANCNIVLQYTCDNDYTYNGATDIAMSVKLRNGATTDDSNEPNNYAEASDLNTDANTGRHESRGWYYECKKRKQNKGLLLLDQKLQGESAEYTRQNPNGNRNGLECPEERDYYPYWWPTPWIDIAYMTGRPAADDYAQDPDTEDQMTVCEIVEQGSQNNNAVYKCTGLVQNNADTYIDQIECVAAGGSWDLYPAKGFDAPACEQADWSRVNHLGNGRDGQHNNYAWTLPAFADLNGYTTYGNTYPSKKCALRLRYNISTDDYDPWNSHAEDNYEVGVEQNPTVGIGASAQGLQLAINTNQFGRTFQDRSHNFFVTQLPSAFSGSTMHNLNVRGKRGNIVQTYPSVEYDFVPTTLNVGTDEFYHLQWTGSNTHNNGGNGGDGQAGDDGQGTGGTDRNNFVSLLNQEDNYPIPLDIPELDDANIIKNSVCYNLNGQQIANWADCAVTVGTGGYARSTAADFSDMDPQLNNAPPSLHGGIVIQTTTPGTYYYMSSRNNNFSNRGQKGWLIVA